MAKTEKNKTLSSRPATHQQVRALLVANPWRFYPPLTHTRTLAAAAEAMSAEMVRAGTLTWVHDGLTAAAFARHAELRADSTLSLFVDARTNKLLEVVRLFDKMAIVLPAELASGSGPWTNGVDPKCRFQIVLTAERDLFFEAASQADADAWVASIQATLAEIVQQRVRCVHA